MEEQIIDWIKVSLLWVPHLLTIIVFIFGASQWSSFTIFFWYSCPKVTWNSRPKVKVDTNWISLWFGSLLGTPTPINRFSKQKFLCFVFVIWERLHTRFRKSFPTFPTFRKGWMGTRVVQSWLLLGLWNRNAAQHFYCSQQIWNGCKQRVCTGTVCIRLLYSTGGGHQKRFKSGLQMVRKSCWSRLCTSSIRAWILLFPRRWSRKRRTTRLWVVQEICQTR